MTHGSLFSGVGGFDIAAEWMGWKNLFNCEINPFCRKVLDYHFKESIGYEDITRTDFSEWRGKVDILTGGFPCQPFSLAGLRKGADDDRYLWPQMLRVIREVRPTWVVGENVAGILSMVQPGEEVEVGNETSLFGETDRKRTLLRQEFVIETVCCDLKREGYSVQPLLIPACAVGAPHRRDRVWFVARKIAANPDSDRRRNGEDKQEQFAQSEGTADNRSGREDGTASDPNGYGYTPRDAGTGIEESGRRDIPQQEEWRDATEWSDGLHGFPRVSSNPDSTGLEGFCLTAGIEKKRREYADGCVVQYPGNKRVSLPADRWHDFPTQSPVCRRDDGLPFDVDSLTIPFTRWRQESVKAYGNAIVPPVAYEIFRAINEIENHEK